MTPNNDSRSGGLLRLALKLPGARPALRYLLSRSDHHVLKSLVFDVDPNGFRAVARARAAAPLTEVLLADDGALLRHACQARDAAAPLTEVLLADNGALLRHACQARDAAVPLTAVLLADDGALLRHACQARDAAVPLAEVLSADDGALLRHVCQARDAAALLPIMASIVVGGRDALELLMGAPGFQDNLAASPRLRALVALIEYWEMFRPILPVGDSRSAARLSEAFSRIEKPEQLSEIALDLITEDEMVHLAHGSLRFPCRHSLWTLMHEILLNEDYHFECESDAPVIIDGGAHMGMAIYYFKSRYPDARITAFEPHPDLHALAVENVARNRWEGVELLPYALAGSRRESTFHISESWSMAGSLSERRVRLGDTVREVAVQCVPLSDYLREPVDFLKLDIEGAEDEVLEEAAPWLHNVANIFCEFHQGAGLSSGRLARILALLEQANFEVQVGKSHNFQERSRWRPLTHFDGPASMVIWARRRYS